MWYSDAIVWSCQLPVCMNHVAEGICGSRSSIWPTCGRDEASSCCDEPFSSGWSCAWPSWWGWRRHQRVACRSLNIQEWFFEFFWKSNGNIFKWLKKYCGSYHHGSDYRTCKIWTWQLRQITRNKAPKNIINSMDRISVAGRLVRLRYIYARALDSYHAMQVSCFGCLVLLFRILRICQQSFLVVLQLSWDGWRTSWWLSTSWSVIGSHHWRESCINCLVCVCMCHKSLLIFYEQQELSCSQHVSLHVVEKAFQCFSHWDSGPTVWSDPLRVSGRCLFLRSSSSACIPLVFQKENSMITTIHGSMLQDDCKLFS